jgi:hypothetical protein
MSLQLALGGSFEERREEPRVPGPRAGAASEPQQ